MIIIRQKNYSNIRLRKKVFGVAGEVGNTVGGAVKTVTDTAKNVAGAGLETAGGAVEAASNVSGIGGAALGAMGMLGPLGWAGGLLAGRLLKKPLKKLGQSIQDTGSSMQN